VDVKSVVSVSNLQNVDEIAVSDSVSNIAPETVVTPKILISSEWLITTGLAEHSNIDNGYEDSIDSVTLFLEASGYFIN